MCVCVCVCVSFCLFVLFVCIFARFPQFLFSLYASQINTTLEANLHCNLFTTPTNPDANAFSRSWKKKRKKKKVLKSRIRKPYLYIYLYIHIIDVYGQRQGALQRRKEVQRWVTGSVLWAFLTVSPLLATNKPHAVKAGAHNRRSLMDESRLSIGRWSSPSPLWTKTGHEGGTLRTRTWMKETHRQCQRPNQPLTVWGRGGLWHFASCGNHVRVLGRRGFATMFVLLIHCTFTLFSPLEGVLPKSGSALSLLLCPHSSVWNLS